LICRIWSNGFLLKPCFFSSSSLQNDRITKLKIDNNPFAKGFRESGQSRCKRKAVSSSPTTLGLNNKSRSDDEGFEHPNPKRLRSDSSACSVSSLEDSALSICETSSGTSSPVADETVLNKFNEMDRLRELSIPHHEMLMHQYNQNLQTVLNPSWIDLVFPYLARNPYHFQSIANYEIPQVYSPSVSSEHYLPASPNSFRYCKSESPSPPDHDQSQSKSPTIDTSDDIKPATTKKCSFSISAILGYDNER
jgi:hypothetical protein